MTPSQSAALLRCLRNASLARRRLLEQAAPQMEAHIVNWAMYLVEQLVNKMKRVREKADSVLGVALPMLISYFEDAAAVSRLMIQVSKELLPALNQIHMEPDCQCYVLKIWYANLFVPARGRDSVV